MISTTATDADPVNHDLPMELRRALTLHRNEEVAQGLILSGIVAGKEQEGLIPRHLLRHNLVVPAHPFRAARRSAGRR